MRVYKKRKTKNKIKQHLQKITIIVLAMLGVLTIENWLVEYAKTIDINRTSTVQIFHKEAEVSGVPSEQPAVVSAVAVPEPKEECVNHDTLCLIKKYFGDDARTATAIMKAESHGNPDAIHINSNKTLDIGLFQINRKEMDENLLDPETNIKVAYEMFQRRGWQPWTAYNNQSYLANL